MLNGLIARLSASPGWQRWAFATPIVRRIARRRALSLFDICAGFVHSQVLLACVELDLFARLLTKRRDAATVAREAGLPLDGAERLLDAAVALGLLSERGGRYGVGPLGAPLATPGSGVAAMIGHHRRLYADLADPLAVFRRAGGGELQRFWPYAGETAAGAPTDPEMSRPYSALMTASQDFVAVDVLAAVGAVVPRGARWVDLGGGEGRFLIEAARRDHALTGAVADLPAVAALARARFAAEGLQDRLRALPIDARDTQALKAEGPFDVACLIRVLHDHDDAGALAFLRAARAALGPGGRLIVAEPMRGAPSDARVSDAYFGPYLFAMGQGRVRHPAEIAALATTAGFAPPREHALPRQFLIRALTFDCHFGLTS